MEIKGSIQSGLGRGAKFVAMDVYSSIFESYLKHPPFPGTLNILLDGDAAKIINHQFTEGIKHENLVQNGKTYGGIIIIEVKLVCTHKHDHMIDAIGVRPLLTSHESDTLEIVAHENLREYLDLEDDCKITIKL